MRTRTDGQLLEIRTPAKVNLFLELLGRRADGFHQLETVIASISLYDIMRFRSRNDGRIQLHLPTPVDSSQGEIPVDRKNTIVHVLELFKYKLQKSHLKTPAKSFGMDVWCLKRIPSQAGLGGASGNAAGAILAANRLWNAGLSIQEMKQLGAEVGSDVPFFLESGTGRCTGRGEQVVPLQSAFNHWIVVAKPPTGLSTGEVYRQCSVPQSPVSASRLSQSLLLGSRALGKELFNRLEMYAEQMTDWIGRLRHSFGQLQSLGHQMSGSGSSYFGLFPNQLAATRAANLLTGRFPSARIFACRTLGRFHHETVECGGCHGNY